MGNRGHNRRGPKRGRLLYLFRGKLCPRLTQCGLGRGLLLYQVASSSIQPFGHNRYGPKIGEGAVPLLGEGELCPHLTQCGPGRPAEAYFCTKLRLHPAVLVTTDKNWGLCPFRGGELRPYLPQRRLGRGLPPYQVAS